jgi:DNA-binding CsgD family transcriptional regulator
MNRYPKQERAPLESLSPRELEVLRLIGDGLSGKEIADKVGISYKTFDTYRSRIKDKLRVRTANGLGALAAETFRRVRDAIHTLTLVRVSPDWLVQLDQKGKPVNRLRTSGLKPEAIPSHDHPR